MDWVSCKKSEFCTQICCALGALAPVPVAAKPQELCAGSSPCSSSSRGHRGGHSSAPAGCRQHRLDVTCCFSDVMCVRGDARTALLANYILHLLLQAKGRGSNPGHSTALPCPAAPCGATWAVSAQSCSQMCPSFPGQGEAGSPRALKNISHLLLESYFSKELPSAPSCGTGGIRI